MKKINWTINHTFILLYVIGFLGAGIIGWFSNSFFAYEEFNSLWATVLYLVFLSLLFVTAFVQEMISDKPIKDKIIGAFVFGGGLAIFLLLYIIGGVVNLCALIYSAILCVVMACRCVLTAHKGEKVKVEVKHFICIGFLLLCSMLHLMKVEFVNDIYMLWSLIPAVVISCILIPTGVVLLRKVWREYYPTKSKSIANAVLIIIFVILISFFYSFTAVGTINCVFDGEPVAATYTVLEKKVQTGGRQITKFEVKVEIDENEKWITLPVTDYHELTEGDTVIIDYYDGALGFGFYVYNGIG